MCISHLFFNLWGERVMDNIENRVRYFVGKNLHKNFGLKHI